jgi:hypothetical protein
VVVIDIVDSEFWLVLPVDVGMELVNHVKYYVLCLYFNFLFV